jgi:lipopolysaccharide transport system permease protein
MEEIVVEAGAGLRHYTKDLWRFRELVFILAWRDISVRYKQTILGIAWSAIRPILMTVVFTIIFGILAKFPNHDVPYPILVLSGMLGWQFFASALESTSSSVIGNSNLISKVYFPRVIIPLSALAISVVDLAINTVILAAVMAWYHYLPSIRILFVPAFLLLAAALTLGLGLWFSALSAKYRDFRVIVPFLIQFGFYLSPVGFSTSIVPANWKFWFALNPMVGIIDGIRWCILPTGPAPDSTALIASIVFSGLILVSGFWVFRSLERQFADVL